MSRYSRSAQDEGLRDPKISGLGSPGFPSIYMHESYALQSQVSERGSLSYGYACGTVF